MRISRRKALAGLGAAFAMPNPLGAQARTREVVDSAGRRVRVPARVSRVYAAGPPASVLLYALAPDTLVGWTSAFRAAERPFVPQRYADLPVLGRLTGRGNTANPETVLAQRPDLIFDYGTINDTYVSLADRVQTQTGVPYLLVDGAFGKMPDAFALLGDILGESARGAQFAAFARETLADIDARVARRPMAQRPRLYFARGPQGLETGLAGSINVEAIEQMGATNVAASLGRGGLAQVSIEQVLLFDPDTIVAVDPNCYAGVFANPGWAS
ncbi:MAG: ABC transporter substrate-binding protein, partial [Rhodospirillales bacterium]